MATDAHIEIMNLTRRFGQREVLKGVNLAVPRGHTQVILGLSGSGKTTLFKHLMGSLTAQAGYVGVDGKELKHFTTADWSWYRQRLGVVFQHAALLGSLTIEENVGLALHEVQRLPSNEIRSRVRTALHRVFLPADEILRLKPADLSGGMRKRVGIARAIVQEPEVLLYDEPTTGLDPVTVTGVGELIRGLQADLGVTSVVISHDLDLTFQIADAVAMLYEGEIIANVSPDAIRDVEHPALRQLLSGSVDGPLTEKYLAKGLASRSLPAVTL